MATPLGKHRLKRFLRHGMLPQLAAFYAVVHLGSVTRAAEELCVAQPTLSGHLRKLSETLGVRLFEPDGKFLAPTDAAIVLLSTVEQVFDAFEQCELRLATLREAALDRAATQGHRDDAERVELIFSGDGVRPFQRAANEMAVEIAAE